jgi:hypothetical protein
MPDYRRVVIRNAFVFNQDRSVETRRTVFSSSKGYYVIVSKYSGLAENVVKPKRGGTTLWLSGSPKEGFILPRGVFSVV